MHRRLTQVGQSGVRVRFIGGNRAGEIRITRFLRNQKVSMNEIISHACAATFDRVGGRHVLAIQDTTSLRDDGNGHSIVAHPTIAVDSSNGALLGLVHADLMCRDARCRGNHGRRKFADKQSYRWLEGARHAASLIDAGASGVTVVGDRESDIYALFALRPQNVDLLVRSNHDRKLESGERIGACLERLAEAGRMNVSLPAAPGRRGRDMELSLRYCQVKLARPQPKADGDEFPASIPLYVVEAKEVCAPAGGKPAHWRLLTTHKIENSADAQTMVNYYRERWTIEQLFRVLKTKGFDIEAVRIEDEEPFMKLAAACLVAAVSVLQLVRDRDGMASRPVSDVFDLQDQDIFVAVSRQLEGKTARQKNPHPPDSLAFAAWVCARLGGWTGYYGKPGPVVMLNGMKQFMAIKHGWSIAKNV